MKRTTYILIGLFVAGLCVLVGGMFVMYCLGRPHFSNQINLQGEQLTKEIPACRVIWLAQTEMHTEECSVWQILFCECCLQKERKMNFPVRRK